MRRRRFGVMALVMGLRIVVLAMVAGDVIGVAPGAMSPQVRVRMADVDRVAIE